MLYLEQQVKPSGVLTLLLRNGVDGASAPQVRPMTVVAPVGATTTLLDLLDDLRDFLKDEDDTEITATRKTRYLNRGLRAMYPKVYRAGWDDSLLLAADVWEYPVPVSLISSTITSVEVETSDTSNRFIPLYDYTVLRADTGSVLRLNDVSLPSSVGARVRFRTAAPLPEFDPSDPVDDAQLYGGPPGTEELPLLYAMGLAAGRRVDQRLDFTRYSTTQAVNGVSENDLILAARTWFEQFELLLDRWAMPMPWVPV